MSVVYGMQPYGGVPHYGYETVPQHRLTGLHVLIASLSLFVGMAGIFTYLVLHNLRPTTAIPANSVAPVALASVSPVKQEAPQVAPLPDNSKALQTDIDNWIAAQKKSTWAVDVQALDGNLFASSNSDRVFTLASIYKLFLLQPLAQKVPSTSWGSTSINGRSYAVCVDAMLRVSDNPCAEAIGARLGWSNIDTVLHGLGYTSTNFTTKTGNIQGTARETTTLLQNLYTKNGFDNATYDTAMPALAAVKKVEGIRRGCNGCKVFNKIGEINGVRHDAAIVEVNGKAYSIVIFSEGGSWQQITDISRIITSYL